MRATLADMEKIADRVGSELFGDELTLDGFHKVEAGANGDLETYVRRSFRRHQSAPGPDVHAMTHTAVACN